MSEGSWYLSAVPRLHPCDDRPVRASFGRGWASLKNGQLQLTGTMRVLCWQKILGFRSPRARCPAIGTKIFCQERCLPNPYLSEINLRVHGAERHPPGRRGRSLCLDAGAWGVLRAGARGVRDRATSSAPPWARDMRPPQAQKSARFCVPILHYVSATSSKSAARPKKPRLSGG